MDRNELLSKWKLLESACVDGEGYLFRLSDDCIPDLNLWINPDGKRGLALKAPHLERVYQKAISKRNLVLEYIENEKMLAIVLLDSSYDIQFNDLILSIYNSIRSEKHAAEYGATFLKMFSTWIQFFEASNSETLSKEEVQGLFGELSVLLHFIKMSDVSQVNSILEAWRGPYDGIHDFVFDDLCCEVKTVGLRTSKIRIASEVQLDVSDHKRLELFVVYTDSSSDQTQSLEDIVTQVKSECERRRGDLTLLYVALYQKNLTIENLSNYSHYGYELLKISIFDCLSEGFPRLTPANIGEAISNVKYSLSLNALGNFKVSDVSNEYYQRV